MNKVASAKYISLNPENDGLYQDVCVIIDQAKTKAYRVVNEMLIKRNWLLGLRIQHEVLKDKRAEYGEQVVKNLSSALENRYGKGFSMRNLYYFISFYQSHPDIFQLVGNAKPDDEDGSKILQAVIAKSGTVSMMDDCFSDPDLYSRFKPVSPLKLTWTHYNIILQEGNREAQEWYEKEAIREMWGTRTLQRNVSSQYYHRLLRSQNKEAVHSEMQKLTAPLQDKLEYLKNPVIAEFLGFADTDDDIAHYSVLNNNDQLFAAKYLPYMPSKEELRREIEQQKEFFRLQNGKGEVLK